MKNLFAAANPYPAVIPPLMSLRFLAVCCVFFYHMYKYMGLPLTNFTLLLSKGYLGVDFFFILSGFILTHVYLPQLQAKNFSVRNFLVHRLARIYPVHIVVLLPMAAMAGRLQDMNLHSLASGRAFIRNILLIHAWWYSRDYSFNWPSWSISAEWFAYLLFPLLLKLIRKNKISMVVFYAVWTYAAFCFISEMLLGQPFTELTVNFGILRIVPEFVLGMSVYLFSLKYAFPVRTGVGASVCTAVFVGGLFVGVYEPVMVSILSLFIYMLADSSRLGKRSFLELRAFTYLGDISYSFYMLHFPVLLCVWFVLAHTYWFVPVTFLATLILSILVYHCVEVPARHFIRRTFVKKL